MKIVKVVIEGELPKKCIDCPFHVEVSTRIMFGILREIMCQFRERTGYGNGNRNNHQGL